MRKTARFAAEATVSVCAARAVNPFMAEDVEHFPTLPAAVASSSPVDSDAEEPDSPFHWSIDDIATLVRRDMAMGVSQPYSIAVIQNPAAIDELQPQQSEFDVTGLTPNRKAAHDQYTARLEDEFEKV